MREPAEIGEESAALHRQVVWQACRDDRGLLDVDAVGCAVHDCVSTYERIDIRRDAELGTPELEVGTFPVFRGEHVIHDEPDRRIELRGERLVQRREPRLQLAGHLRSDLVLDPLLLGGGCRWRGALRRRLRSGRRPARADLVDRLLLLADRLLHLLHLALHRLKLALQVVDRGILGERARGEDEQRGERHECDTTPE